MTATQVVVPLQLSSRARNQTNHLPKIYIFQRIYRYIIESETKRTQKAGEGEEEGEGSCNSERNKIKAFSLEVCYANQEEQAQKLNTYIYEPKIY